MDQLMDGPKRLLKEWAEARDDESVNDKSNREHTRKHVSYLPNNIPVFIGNGSTSTASFDGIPNYAANDLPLPCVD